MAEITFDPVLTCGCYDEKRKEYVGPTFLPNAVGEKRWQCSHCAERPVFKGWRLHTVVPDQGANTP